MHIFIYFPPSQCTHPMHFKPRTQRERRRSPQCYYCLSQSFRTQFIRAGNYLFFCKQLLFTLCLPHRRRIRASLPPTCPPSVRKASPLEQAAAAPGRAHQGAPQSWLGRSCCRASSPPAPEVCAAQDASTNKTIHSISKPLSLLTLGLE